MFRNLAIICIVLSLFGACNSEPNEKIIGTWAMCYMDDISANDSMRWSANRIIHFTKDSFIVIDPIDLSENIIPTKRHHYKLSEHYISIEEDSFEYKLIDESTLQYTLIEENSTHKVYLKRIKPNGNDFKESLENKAYEFKTEYGSDVYYFMSDSTFVIGNQLDMFYGESKAKHFNKYRIYNCYGITFIAFDEFLSTFTILQEDKDSTLSFLSYGPTAFTTDAHRIFPKHKPDEILGKWVYERNDDYPLPIYVNEADIDDYNLYLNITEDSIEKTEFGYTMKSSYRLGPLNNHIYFEIPQGNEFLKWEIKGLQDSLLKIEYLVPRLDSHYPVTWKLNRYYL